MIYKTAMTIKLNTITISVYGRLTYEKTIKESTETSSPMTRVTDDFEVGYSGLVRHVHVNKNYEALPNGKWFDGYSGVVRDVNEAEPRLGFEKKGVLKAKKKTETKPVPFSKVALASIKEALDAGGFKNWADFQSLKGVGPVTSKIMEDLGWAEPVYFFYEEDPLSSGTTRVSPYYTLDQIKKKHPNGTGFQKRNFPFCAGAVTTLDHHPGLRKYSVPKKRKKVEEREPMLADLTNPCAGELLDPRNRIVVTNRRRVERLVGWKARNPHVEPGQGVKTKHGTFHQGSCCLLVPEGYNEVLVKILVRSKLNCRLADVLGMPKRPKDKEETCESVGWTIAPNRLQDHKVKVRKEASRLIDVDRDVENIINAAELEEQRAAQQAEDLKRKQGNKNLEKGKMPKMSPEEWGNYLLDCYVERYSGVGKTVASLRGEAERYQRLIADYCKAVTEETKLPCTEEEYEEAVQEKYFKAAQEYQEVMETINGAPELARKLWFYTTFIEGKPLEFVLKDRLQADDPGGSFFSADQKSFEALEEATRRNDPNYMEVLWGREDYGWEYAQIGEMEANRREVMSLEVGLVNVDQKLGYKEKEMQLKAVKHLFRIGRPEQETTLSGNKTVVNSEIIGQHKELVFVGMQANYAVPYHRQFVEIFQEYYEEGKKEKVYVYRTRNEYSRGAVIQEPRKAIVIPAIPPARSEAEFDAKVAEFLRTRTYS